MPRPPLYIPGQRIGRLTILKRRGVTHGRSVIWECHCDCGKEVVLPQTTLSYKNQHGLGCGECLNRYGTSTTHGDSYSAEYAAWHNMKSRCYNKNTLDYQRYGGRGITVCPRWLDSYENFLSDLGRRPSSRHTLDRIDNNGNYEPNNCRWVTYWEQERNKQFYKE